MTQVISAFPGTGKSYFHRTSGKRVLDSDSSKFSWIKEGVRHPDFPNNYMAHIKENLDRADYIRVSSHDAAIAALNLENSPEDWKNIWKIWRKDEE